MNCFASEQGIQIMEIYSENNKSVNEVNTSLDRLLFSIQNHKHHKFYVRILFFT